MMTRAGRPGRARDRGRGRRRRPAARPSRPSATTPLAVRLLAREVRADVAAAKRPALHGPRPRAPRSRRAARVAVVVRQPRPAELAGRSRPTARVRGAAARARRRPARGRLRVVRAGQGARDPGHHGAAAERPGGGPGAHRAATVAGRGDAAPLRARIRQQAWYGEGSRPGGHAGGPRRGGGRAGRVGRRAHVVPGRRRHACTAWSWATGLREVVRLGGFGPVRALLSGMQADLDMAASSPAGRPARRRRGRAAGSGREAWRSCWWSRSATGSTADRVVVVPPAPLAGHPVVDAARASATGC